MITSIGLGNTSWVCPPNIISIPLTLDAIFLSTSTPLWDNKTIKDVFSLALMRLINSCNSLSRIPKVRLGINRPGFAIGVYGKAWPITATLWLFIVFMTYGF